MGDMGNTNNLLSAELQDIINNTEVSASDVIKKIYNKPDWVSHVDDRLRYKEYVCPKDSNETLDDWVRMYVDKKSRRVSYAGKKLKEVFLKLPGAEKRKAALALLTGGKEDTEWVCKRLKNYKESFDKEWEINWHPSYSQAIEECWKKYHGEYCGLLFIQFLDEKLVREHLEELGTFNNYFYICQRFVNKPWFKLDVEKLKSCTHINAYLSVMSQTEEGITEEEARFLLYQWVSVAMDMCRKRCNDKVKENIFYSSRTDKIRIINAWGIDTALYYLWSMNLKNVVLDFLKCDESIFNVYYFEETTEDVTVLGLHNEDFRQLVFDRFPEELKYLLYPNTKDYQFASSPGQPFVKPKRNEYWRLIAELEGRIETEEPPMYLPIQCTTSSPSEDYEKLKENPIFSKLEEALGLSPIENPSFIDKHMKEHDLPF